MLVTALSPVIAMTSVQIAHYAVDNDLTRSSRLKLDFVSPTEGEFDRIVDGEDGSPSMAKASLRESHPLINTQTPNQRGRQNIMTNTRGINCFAEFSPKIYTSQQPLLRLNSRPLESLAAYQTRPKRRPHYG